MKEPAKAFRVAPGNDPYGEASPEELFRQWWRKPVRNDRLVTINSYKSRSAKISRR
jgi:hypothetical protein